MAASRGALVVIGSGPGIGSNVAKLFAEHGFNKILLLSRDSARLQKDAAIVKSVSNDVSVDTVTIDLADTAQVQKSLSQVDKLLNGVPLECVLYNAARVGVSKILEWPAESLESDLRISVVSLYTSVQWAVPQLLKAANDNELKPSFLVTSGLLYKDPFPMLFSLAACKAGQYNLVTSLHKEFTPKGIHFALIVVGGSVADKSQVTNARNIAEEAWKLYEQPKGKGDLEVEMLDPDYMAHIKRREGEISS